MYANKFEKLMRQQNALKINNKRSQHKIYWEQSQQPAATSVRRKSFYLLCVLTSYWLIEIHIFVVAYICLLFCLFVVQIQLTTINMRRAWFGYDLMENRERERENISKPKCSFSSHNRTTMLCWNAIKL